MGARLLVLLAAAVVVVAAPADAAYPGANGRIAFVRMLEVERLAATSDPGSIWSVRADGTDERRLTRSRWGDSDPAWSPDGRRIAFVRDFAESLSSPYVGSELMVMNADGSGVRRLTRNAVADGSPVWSRDGRRLFFVRDDPRGLRPARPGADVWVLALNGLRARRVVRTPELESELAISARGDRLAYLVAWPERWFHPVEGVAYWQIGDARQLWTMRVDGRERRWSGITSTTFRPSLALGDSISRPTWTPRGRVAIASWGRVFSLQPDGEDVFVQGPGSDVAWSPDGRELVSSRGDETGASLYVRSGGSDRRVTSDSFPDERAFDREPDWQPLRRS